MTSSGAPSVVITDGASGFGPGTATAFAKAGAAVELVGRDSRRLAGCGESLNAESAIYRVVDVSEWEQFKQAMDKIAEAFKGLDVFVYSAGLYELTHPLVRALSVLGITVNAVAPGFIADTAFNGDFLTAARGKVLAKTPMGRVGHVDGVTARQLPQVASGLGRDRQGPARRRRTRFRSATVATQVIPVGTSPDTRPSLWEGIERG